MVYETSSTHASFETAFPTAERTSDLRKAVEVWNSGVKAWAEKKGLGTPFPSAISQAEISQHPQLCHCNAEVDPPLSKKWKVSFQIVLGTDLVQVLT